MTETTASAPTTEVPVEELRQLFERGAVYADRFPPHVRAALDVPDPLTEVVAQALRERRSVVISGNAGDGKSHLAQRALDLAPGRSCLEVTSATEVPSSVPAETVVFVRDVSALTNQQVISAVKLARDSNAPALITINEGPLQALADDPDGEFFVEVRRVLHDRMQGFSAGDPAGCTILSLSGRQLAKSAFVDGALEKLLPLVGPCARCGRSQACPRVVGAKMLRRSRRGRARLADLLRLLTDRGQHLSARDIWVFLIDLFYGWTCSPGGDEISRSEGFFWSRIFASEQRTAKLIAREFDPVNSPMAHQDVHLWQGRFDALDFEIDYPGPSPASEARDSRDDGLRAFAGAKRALFFFSKSLDHSQLLASQTDAPKFGALLAKATSDERLVIRDLVGLINHYRLEERTETDLWISRHHSMAAHRRPSTLAASNKLPLEALGVRVPFASEAARYPEAGFFPDHLLLHWKSSEQTLAISFETWLRLQEQRSLTVDRDQEALDFALDLFMSQAAVPAVADPEIRVFDHDHHERSVLRVRPESKTIETL